MSEKNGSQRPGAGQCAAFVAVLAAATALADFLSALLGLVLCRAVFREGGRL